MLIEKSDKFPIFHNIRTLDLHGCFLDEYELYDKLEALGSFLQSAPCLEKLILKYCMDEVGRDWTIPLRPTFGWETSGTETSLLRNIPPRSGTTPSGKIERTGSSHFNVVPCRLTRGSNGEREVVACCLTRPPWPARASSAARPPWPAGTSSVAHLPWSAGDSSAAHPPWPVGASSAARPPWLAGASSAALRGGAGLGRCGEHSPVGRASLGWRGEGAGGEGAGRGGGAGRVSGKGAPGDGEEETSGQVGPTNYCI
uniref:FBD domain-containing protein n=1 Tax=Setaria viridis TaxID=4556 RepID=A0A4U6VQW8_SETVI|nr:cuticle collagen 2-like [Setaria viridis]TKW31255.1 hypothetical protein SEVIR_2G093460v2 [Setaria viridis]